MLFLERRLSRRYYCTEREKERRRGPGGTSRSWRIKRPAPARSLSHNFTLSLPKSPLSPLFRNALVALLRGFWTMSQRLGGLAESLLRLGSGGGEGAGRAGSGGEPESASSALAAVAASADEEGSAPTFFNPTGTVSSNESTPRMQQAIVGSPFPFLLRQQPHHHHRGRQGGDAHAPATTTTGFAAPASFSSAASLEEPLLSVEGVPQTAAAAPEFGDLEAGKRNGEQRRAAAGAGATGPTEQQQEPAAAAATAGSASASASASAAADAASAKRRRTKELVTSLVYGAINALVGLPTLVSFSIIVYGTRAVYRPYVPPPPSMFTLPQNALF